jgi:hypothetical protein
MKKQKREVSKRCQVDRIHAHPTSSQVTHQLVTAFGKISRSMPSLSSDMPGVSSCTAKGVICDNHDEQLSCPSVTLRAMESKSEYRFHTPTVFWKLPSRYTTRNCAYLPNFLDYQIKHIKVNVRPIRAPKRIQGTKLP